MSIRERDEQIQRAWRRYQKEQSHKQERAEARDYITEELGRVWDSLFASQPSMQHNARS